MRWARLWFGVRMTLKMRFEAVSQRISRRATDFSVFLRGRASGPHVFAPMRPLYDYGWFVGFLAAGAIYVTLKGVSPRKAQSL